MMPFALATRSLLHLHLRAVLALLVAVVSGLMLMAGSASATGGVPSGEVSVESGEDEPDQESVDEDGSWVEGVVFEEGAGAPEARGTCREPQNGQTRGRIVDMFFDQFSCKVPLRFGDWRHGWGADHVDHRCNVDGEVNHCRTTAWRYRTQAALSGPSMRCVDRLGVMSYYLNYNDGKNRYHRVIVETNDYAGLGRLGIRTSFWGTGTKTSC